TVRPGGLTCHVRRYAAGDARWEADPRVGATGSPGQETHAHAFRDAAFAAFLVRARSVHADVHADMHALRAIEDRLGDIGARRFVPELVRRVMELVSLRHDGATVAEVVHTAGTGQATPPYLRVVRRRDGMVGSWPVGVCEHGVDTTAVDAFA